MAEDELSTATWLHELCAAMAAGQPPAPAGAAPQP